DTVSFFNAKNIVIFDDNKTGFIEHCPIIGTIDDLIRMRPTDDVFNCVGSVSDNRVRNRIYEKLKAADIKVKPLLLCAFISLNAKIGENVLANIGSQIHHDCVIGDNSVISPGVIICGNVTLEGNNFVGAGAVIIQGLTIGANAIVGAGSIVIHDVPPNAVMVGNPARFIK
ncbi:MAG: hypothetical protein PHQ35_09790, partial [Phycisphaerae bacterium]|nr:hypothetical protein [Phycisphaerae bacterium]